MRSIISARSVNPSDLRAYGIHAMTPTGDFHDPDLSDLVDADELAAVNRSLAPHAAEIEVEDFVPRRSYKIADYLPVAPKPTPPAKAGSVRRRRLAA